MSNERVALALIIGQLAMCSGRREHVLGPSARSEVTAREDTTRMPVPPRSATVIDVTSPITISGTVTDLTYNVTGSMPKATAISLSATGRLERVRVNVNG